MSIIHSSPASFVVLLLGFFLLSALFLRAKHTLRRRRSKAGFAMSRWHLLFMLLCGVAVFLWSADVGESTYAQIALILFCTAIAGATIFTLWRYKRIFKYEISSRLDPTNHWLQISILATIAMALVLIICLFHIDQNSFLPFSLFAVIMTWLFQDAVLGVAAYIHLRSNHLLHIGDYISIPDKNLQGKVADISLISVTIDTPENTRMSIPICSLQKGAFINMQNLFDGNTSGRRLLRTFIIDTRSISEITQDDLKTLISEISLHGEDSTALTTELKHLPEHSTILNIFLYRKYLRHWLCNCYEVARHPRLIVSLEAHCPEGIPLKVYAYIKQTQLEPYDHIVAEITEHILNSMTLFGLRLYQRPTADDIHSLLGLNDDNR